MKKYIPILCLLVFLTTGCSRRVRPPKIEDYEWVLDLVQSFEAEGQIVASGADNAYAAQGVPVVELEARAANGKLTLTGLTNNCSYAWNYQHMQDDLQSNIYEIATEDGEGLASVSMTSYHDGTQIPTLIIRLEDYALNLKAR